RNGVERHVEAFGQGHFLELRNVHCALAGFAAVVLVFELNADDGAAVFPKQAASLGPQLVPVGAHGGQVGGVVAAQGAGRQFLHEPVGKAAVAQFGVVPGTDAGQH
nr:hypothetical protein [Tanacetum cinerariifolium]